MTCLADDGDGLSAETGCQLFNTVIRDKIGNLLFYIMTKCRKVKSDYITEIQQRMLQFKDTIIRDTILPITRESEDLGSLFLCNVKVLIKGFHFMCNMPWFTFTNSMIQPATPLKPPFPILVFGQRSFGPHFAIKF